MSNLQSHLYLKGHYVILEEEIQTLNLQKITILMM